jgi:hypothetical protein
VIAASVQYIVRAEAASWLVVHMYRRHAALFSSASGVWSCALCGEVLTTATINAGALCS